MKMTTKIACIALSVAALSTTTMANNVGKKLSTKAAIACKNYVLDKTKLPQAAVSVNASRVYGDPKEVFVPVAVKWDDPRVDEEGECVYKHGNAISYRIFED